jgi:hypothetical protein
MRHVKHPRTLRSDPVLLGKRSALRTMPISTGVVGGVLVAAALAGVEVATERRCAALRDVSENALLPRVQAYSLLELRAVLSNDIGEVEVRRPVLGAHVLPAWLREQVEWTRCLPDQLLGDASVSRRRFDTGVPQQHAHNAHVRALFEEVSRETVAKRMWRHALLNPSLFRGLLQRLAHRAGRWQPAVSICE